MVRLPIYSRSGSRVGEYELDPKQLAPRINKQLLHDVVVMYQANRRQGTHQTKTRSMVAGTTKKMYRQKGTGTRRARTGAVGYRGGRHTKEAVFPGCFSVALPAKGDGARGGGGVRPKGGGQQGGGNGRRGWGAPKNKKRGGRQKAFCFAG